MEILTSVAGFLLTLIGTFAVFKWVYHLWIPATKRTKFYISKCDLHNPETLAEIKMLDSVIETITTVVCYECQHEWN